MAPSSRSSLREISGDAAFAAYEEMGAHTCEQVRWSAFPFLRAWLIAYAQKSGPTMYSQDRYVKSDSISRQALDRPQDDPLYIVRINRCQVLYPKFAEASVGVQGIRHVQLHIHPPSEASDIGGL